jgi:diaminopimelate decarboxylase
MKKHPRTYKNETPALVLDGERFMSLVEDYKKLGAVYYPVKSNSSAEIIGLLREAGCDFLVNCPYYLDKLLSLNLAPEQILYDNCGADPGEIAHAARVGVTFFYTDSEEHFAEIALRCPEAHFLIKVSSDAATKKRGKYGIADFSSLAEKIAGTGSLAGLGFYIPDASFCACSLEKQLDCIFDKKISPQNGGTGVEMLNIGGSLKGILTDQRQQSLLSAAKERGLFKKLLLEPGRNLLNPCVSMETRVIKRRTLNGENRLHLDASIYSGLMDVYIENKRLSIRAHGSSAPHDTPYLVYGKTSDSADFLGEHRLPTGLCEGDTLSIAECGAYCWDMAQVYSGARPLTLRVKNGG